jgi:hypothetical protein
LWKHRRDSGPAVSSSLDSDDETIDAIRHDAFVAAGRAGMASPVLPGRWAARENIPVFAYFPYACNICQDKIARR